MYNSNRIDSKQAVRVVQTAAEGQMTTAIFLLSCAILHTPTRVSDMTKSSVAAQHRMIARGLALLLTSLVADGGADPRLQA